MKTPLQRKIVDFKKLTEEILSLLVSRYPDGYENKDIITFKNAQGETIEAVEVCSEDTKYLVKVSKRLENSMHDYEENLDNDSSYNDDNIGTSNNDYSDDDDY